MKVLSHIAFCELVPDGTYEFVTLENGKVAICFKNELVVLDIYSSCCTEGILTKSGSRVSLKREEIKTLPTKLMKDKFMQNGDLHVLTVRGLKQALALLPDEADDMVVVVHDSSSPGQGMPGSEHHTFRGLKVMRRTFAPHYTESEQANPNAEVLFIGTMAADAKIESGCYKEPQDGFEGQYSRCPYILIRDEPKGEWVDEDVARIRQGVPGLAAHSDLEIEALYSCLSVEQYSAGWTHIDSGTFKKFLDGWEEKDFLEAWEYL